VLEILACYILINYILIKQKTCTKTKHRPYTTAQTVAYLTSLITFLSSIFVIKLNSKKGFGAKTKKKVNTNTPELENV